MVAQQAAPLSFCAPSVGPPPSTRFACRSTATRAFKSLIAATSRFSMSYKPKETPARPAMCSGKYRFTGILFRCRMGTRHHCRSVATFLHLTSLDEDPPLAAFLAECYRNASIFALWTLARCWIHSAILPYYLVHHDLLADSLC